MSLFGKSFPEQVEAALDAIRKKMPELHTLSAQVDGKTVTLMGEAPSTEAKGRVSQAFNELVKDAEQVFNKMRLPAAAAMSAPAAAAETQPLSVPAPAAPLPPPATEPERIHVVVSGDTLGKLAKHYYGNAGQYMRIFEANRDQLSNPDLIKVGQKLKIPA